MRLILTRHGETVENRKGIHQGHLPGRLNKTGIEQAKKLALRLKNEKIDAVYSSDLARAADTTKEIIKFHPNILVHYVVELREGFGGRLQGMKNKDIDWENKPPEAETRADVRKRGKKLLNEVYKKYPDQVVLFVAHQGTNNSLIREILNKSNEDNLEKQENTAVNIFEINKNKDAKIICLTCIKHLK